MFVVDVVFDIFGLGGYPGYGYSHPGDGFEHIGREDLHVLTVEKMNRYPWYIVNLSKKAKPGRAVVAPYIAGVVAHFFVYAGDSSGSDGFRRLRSHRTTGIEQGIAAVEEKIRPLLFLRDVSEPLIFPGQTAQPIGFSAAAFKFAGNIV